MSLTLSIVLYLCATVFYGRVLSHMLMIARSSAPMEHGRNLTPQAVAMGFLDVLLLRRLFNANKLLWPFELAFHVSFGVIVFAHLRYVYYYVPSAVALAQPVGGVASYLLCGSLGFIVIYRLLTWSSKYATAYNMFLTVVLLIVSVTGFLMAKQYRIDVAGARTFMLSALSFKSAEAPGGWLFAVHFSCAMLFIASIPTHIFTAPFTALEADRRESNLTGLLHEEGNGK